MENKRIYDESIILIGPSGAGKSTVAEELKRITGMPRVCLDAISSDLRRKGIRARFDTSEEYNLYLIKNVIQNAEKEDIPGIADFGAGHSVYDNERIFGEVKKELSKFKNIVLILPSADVKESLDIMEKRSTGDTRNNRKFITSPCNRDLATITVYANGRTPKEIAEEIMQKIENKEKEDEGR